MYEPDQKALYRVYATFALVLLVLASYVCVCIHASRANTDGLQSSTDGEIGAIKEQQLQVGTEIGRAADKIGNAENSIDRVGEAISESRERAAALQAGIAECQSIARECQELATENLNIIGDIGG